jgi:hypothetical protein
MTITTIATTKQAETVTNTITAIAIAIAIVTTTTAIAITPKNTITHHTNQQMQTANSLHMPVVTVEEKINLSDTHKQIKE